MSSRASDLISAPVGTGYIWRPTYAQNTRETVSSLTSAKRSFIEQLPSALRSCERKATLTREQLDAILQEFTRRISTRDFGKLVRFISRSLRKGERELSWTVAVPANQFHYPREGSFFRPERFQLLHRARAIQQAVLTLPCTDSWQVEYGRLLLAAILFGGLLDTTWLTAWLTAVKDRHVFRNQRYLWVEMQRSVQGGHQKRDDHRNNRPDPDDGQEVTIHRRWFADPVSRLLICRLLANEMNQGKAVSVSLLQSSINQFLVAANLEEPRGISISKLVLMGEMVVRLAVPANLASYATGSLVSVSLTEPVWARLLTGRLIPNHHLDEELSEESLHVSHVSPQNQLIPGTRQQAPYVRQQDFLKETRLLLGGKIPSGGNQAKIWREIMALISLRPLSPINRLLFQWAAYLISPHGRNKASTALRYLGAIGNYLIVVCGTDDCAEQEPSWYQQVYEKVLGAIRREQEKSYAHRTLGLFHRYLVAHHGAPPLENTFFITRTGPPELTVDANLLTCTEFDRVKALLGYDDPQRPRYATAAIILAILGFRCGLRRNEAYFLRARDLKGNRHLEIIVRPYTKRGLKSGAATRRIPLYALLPEDELQLMLEWRSTLLGQDNTLLFSRTGLADSTYQAEQLFGAIRKAMHQATGDSTLRFHHLRHSCLTWLFVRLNGDGGNLRSRADFLDHHEFDDIRVQCLRHELLANETLGRKGAYATALFSGHTDPATTFRNYIHICDFLLGNQLTRSSKLTSLNNRQFANLSGIPAPTVYRYYDKSSCLNLPGLLENAAKRAGIIEPPSWQNFVPFSAPPMRFGKEHAAEMRWTGVMKALALFQSQKRTPLEISETLGFHEDTIRAWFDNVRYLANLRVPGQQGAYRHRIVAKNMRLTGYDSEGREVWNIKGLQKTYYRPARHVQKPQPRSLLSYTIWKKSASQQMHPDLFPTPPRTNGDKQLLHTIMSTFERLNPQQRLFVTDFADFFCENFILNSGGVWYLNPTWTKKHIETALMLAIPASSLQLIDIETIGETAAGIASRRAEWEKSLVLKKGITWTIAEQRLSRKRTSCGVSIRVLAKPGGTASYAFRYAMYLIRIGYWE